MPGLHILSLSGLERLKKKKIKFLPAEGYTGCRGRIPFPKNTQSLSFLALPQHAMLQPSCCAQTYWAKTPMPSLGTLQNKHHNTTKPTLSLKAPPGITKHSYRGGLGRCSSSDPFPAPTMYSHHHFGRCLSQITSP